MTIVAGASPSFQTEETEQRRPEHEEMQQGLAQQTRHGVYQIGEV